MQKIAIISDIHGNLEALNAVLKDIKKRKIKKIYCLGDIINKGYHYSECIKLIQEKCEVVIRGNSDEYFSEEHDLTDKTEQEKQRILWNKSRLSDEERNYLLNLPFCYEFYMSGSLIRLLHCTPNKVYELCSNIDTIEKKRTMFLPSPNTVSQELADIVICGHTHIQWLERMYNRTIINVGSVGNPTEIINCDHFNANDQETTRANYLIIEGRLDSKTYEDNISFQFVRVPYNHEKELLASQQNIEFESYKTELLHGRYRDISKIEESLKNHGINAEVL